jgi:hypothetical protein
MVSMAPPGRAIGIVPTLFRAEGGGLGRVGELRTLVQTGELGDLGADDEFVGRLIAVRRRALDALHRPQLQGHGFVRVQQRQSRGGADHERPPVQGVGHIEYVAARDRPAQAEAVAPGGNRAQATYLP